MKHPAVSCFVKLPVNLSGICALCQKYRIPPLFWKFFQKRACNFSVIVLLLYPTKAGCWIHSVPPPLFFFLFLPSYYCYFLHLPSYHLPCLPERAKKRWPICTGPSLFFLSFILRSAGRTPAGHRRRSRGLPERCCCQADGDCPLCSTPKRRPGTFSRFGSANPATAFSLRCRRWQGHQRIILHSFGVRTQKWRFTKIVLNRLIVL